MKKSVDYVLVWLIIALGFSLLMFASGLFPYPFGIILLIAFIIARWLSLKNRPKDDV